MSGIQNYIKLEIKIKPTPSNSPCVSKSKNPNFIGTNPKKLTGAMFLERYAQPHTIQFKQYPIFRCMRHEILSECQIPYQLYAFFITLFRYNSHRIKKLTFLKYTIGYIFRAVQKLLSNYRAFLGSKRNPISINSQPPFFSPQPLAISNLLSASSDLHILEISCK